MRAAPARLILLTGVPRSGTTAVGRALSLAAHTGNLHEPFNYLVGLREVERYFEIPGDEGMSTDEFDARVDHIKWLDLKFKAGVFPRDRGLRRVLKRIGGGRAINSWRLCRLTPGIDTIVWKDPFAFFCIDRLVAHDVETLILLRNPWAVAASFKRMAWSFDLDDIVRRLRLVGRAADIDGLPQWSARDDAVCNASLLWRLLYGSLLTALPRSALVVDLDHIVSAPLKAYPSIYQHLRLPWSERIARKIAKHYGRTSTRREPAARRAHDANRDLSAVNAYWQRILDPGEIATVNAVNEKIWHELCDTVLTGRDASAPGEIDRAVGNAV